MKREQLSTFLQATLLAWGAALGGLGMIVTGLNLDVSMVGLAIFSLILSLGLGFLLRMPKGIWIALGAEVAIWLLPGMRLELKVLGRKLVRYMTMAYGLECPRWLSGGRADTLIPVLLVLGSLIMLPWIVSVLKGKSVAPGIIAWLFPLFFCITVTDTVPDIPWLFLWMLSLILLLLTGVVRRSSEHSGNRLLLILLVPSILGLSLLFWFIPEKKADHWEVMSLMQDVYDTFAPDTSHKKSDTDKDTDTDENAMVNAQNRVNLATMKERNLTDRKVMDVTAEQSRVLYLRGRDYDQYTGVAWESTEGRLEMYHISTMTSRNGGSVVVEAEYGRDFYFLPCYLSQSMTLQNGKAPNVNRGKSYTFYLIDHRYDWAKITEATMADEVPGLVQTSGGYIEITEVYQTQAMENFERYKETYLQLPEETRTWAVSYLTANGFPSGASLPDQAQYIQTLVQHSATYDLQTGRMPDDQDDLAMWFLQESDTGYCVHFATAAAVLLRAAGIPARYVEGYLVEVTAGETVPVEQRNGHGWVEYYAPGMGWMILEATPAAGVQDTATVQPTEPEEPTQPSTTEPPETTKPTETTQPTEPSATEPSVTQPQPQQEQPASGSVWWWLIPVGVVALAVMSIPVRYGILRRKRDARLRRGSTNARGIACYRELLRISDYLGLPVPGEVTTVAEKAKFSQHTLTREELQQLHACLGSMRQAVQDLPTGKRLAAKWIWIYL